MDFEVFSAFVIIFAFAALMTALARSDDEASAAKVFVTLLAIASWCGLAVFTFATLAGLGGDGG